MRRAKCGWLVLVVLVFVSSACGRDFDVFEQAPDGGVTASPDGAPIGSADAAVGSDGAAGGDGGGGRDARPDGLVATDSGTCVLPAGATMCCGPVACVGSAGQCAAACTACQSRCTDPKKQVCCAQGGGGGTPQVSCESKPSDC